MSIAFRLPEELTIYTVAQTRQELLAWLDASQDAQEDSGVRQVQAQAVSDFDGAGLQLLGALANTLAARDQTLVLQEPSEAVRRVCHQLGCTGWFEFQPPGGTP